MLTPLPPVFPNFPLALADLPASEGDEFAQEPALFGVLGRRGAFVREETLKTLELPGDGAGLVPVLAGAIGVPAVVPVIPALFAKLPMGSIALSDTPARAAPGSLGAVFFPAVFPDLPVVLPELPLQPGVETGVGLFFGGDVAGLNGPVPGVGDGDDFGAVPAVVPDVPAGVTVFPAGLDALGVRGGGAAAEAEGGEQNEGGGSVHNGSPGDED